MKKIMTPKVGLIATMSYDWTKIELTYKKLIDDHKKAKAAMEAVGMQVITATERTATTREEIIEDCKYLRDKGVEVVVLYVGWWTFANFELEIANVLKDVPVLIWTNSGGGNIGLVGASVTRGSFDEIGAKVKLIHGAFEDEETIEKIRTWCVGAAAATRFNGLVMGIGGGPTLGMYTGTYDTVQIKKTFGIDVEGWDQATIFERAEKEISDQDAYQFLDWMKKEFGGVTSEEKVTIMQIKLYLALKKLIAERNYSIITVRCLPDLPTVHTTFCLAHAILNDQSDADGPKESVVCGCESDVNGALSMQMLKHVSGQPAYFGDYLQFNPQNKEIGLCNCGSSPTDFAKDHKDVIWVHEGLAEFAWKHGSANPQYVARSGFVTMARLSRINGEYVMAIGTGDAVYKDREVMRELNYYQPQAFVKIHADTDAFFDNLRSNHCHMVYGNYVKELVIECEMLGIKPIVY